MAFPVYAANKIIALNCAASGRKFWKNTPELERIQEDKLLSYIKQNKDTRFGRAHNFYRIRSYKEYKKEVPLTDFIYYRDYIGALTNGKQNQLTAKPVTLLEPTSGTSSGTKLIPYTKVLQSEFMAGVKPWLADLYSTYPSLLKGKSYWSISPIDDTGMGKESKIPIGFEDDSDYFGILRSLLQSIYPVPKQIKRIHSIENFRYITCLLLLAVEDLTLISVWNPSFLTILMDYCTGHIEELLRSLKSGRLQWPVIEMNLPKIPFGRYPERGEYLESVFQTPNPGRRIWPRLSLISCWTSAQSRNLLPSLETYFQGVQIQGKGLLTTEGIVSFPVEASKGSVLAYKSHFFEFLEEESEEIVLSHQLEKGKSYSVILTTGGGLYRYQLDDVVEVSHFYKGLPVIIFLGRSNTSDLAGEKLSEVFVSKVLDTLFAGFPPCFALLAPVKQKDSYCYCLFLNKTKAEESNQFLLKQLEALLYGNYHYAYARKTGQLSDCMICEVDKDAHRIFQEFQISKGKKAGDIKIVSLYTDTDIEKCFHGEGIYAYNAY